MIDFKKVLRAFFPRTPEGHEDDYDVLAEKSRQLTTTHLCLTTYSARRKMDNKHTTLYVVKDENGVEHRFDLVGGVETRKLADLLRQIEGTHEPVTLNYTGKFCPGYVRYVTNEDNVQLGTTGGTRTNAINIPSSTVVERVEARINENTPVGNVVMAGHILTQSIRSLKGDGNTSLFYESMANAVDSVVSNVVKAASV